VCVIRTGEYPDAVASSILPYAAPVCVCACVCVCVCVFVCVCVCVCVLCWSLPTHHSVQKHAERNSRVAIVLQGCHN
jgi:hypothetical protein